MIIGTTLVSLMLGWVARERAQSQRELAVYGAIDRSKSVVSIGGRFDLDADKPWASEQPLWRKSLGTLLGHRIYILEWTECDLAPIADLGSLAILSIRCEEGVDVRLLPSSRTLKSLHVKAPTLENVASLAQQPRLSHLDIDLTSVPNLALLADVRTLEEIGVTSEELRDLTGIGKLTGLKKLSIISSQVDDLTPIANLKMLEEITFSSGQIMDYSPLKSLSKLSVVNLVDDAATDTNGKRIASIMPDCEITLNYSTFPSP